MHITPFIPFFLSNPFALIVYMHLLAISFALIYKGISQLSLFVYLFSIYVILGSWNRTRLTVGCVARNWAYIIILYEFIYLTLLLILNQTWPTEADMAEADENNKRRKIQRKKLPPGTSDYQVFILFSLTENDIRYDLKHENFKSNYVRAQCLTCEPH